MWLDWLYFNSYSAVQCFVCAINIVQATPEIHTMAKFLMELCLPDYNMLEFHPSKLSAAALFLSIKICGDRQWVSLI